MFWFSASKWAAAARGEVRSGCVPAELPSEVKPTWDEDSYLKFDADVLRSSWYFLLWITDHFDNSLYS